jgi:hypothetical protein
LYSTNYTTLAALFKQIPVYFGIREPLMKQTGGMNWLHMNVVSERKPVVDIDINSCIGMGMININGCCDYDKSNSLKDLSQHKK